MRLRRLEAEPIRDALLAVAGQLDATMGGPPVVARARPDGLVEIEDKAGPAARVRRSVYLLYRRSYNHSLLTVFDQPLVAQNAPTAMRRPCRCIADNAQRRLRRRAGEALRPPRRADGGRDRPAGNHRGFRLALARSPTAAETAVGYRLLDRLAATYRAAGRSAGEAERLALVHWCHALLNTSEFLYVE